MKLKTSKPRYMRRKADVEAWESKIDALARSICPSVEWREYQRHIHRVAWRTSAGSSNRGTVYVFPVWRKYRQKALQVATLYQALPLLKHLPLRFSCMLGDLLFK